MTAYLGPLGNLVGFLCPSAEQIEQADNVSTEVTLGGVQKAQYGPRAPRSWQVSLGTATPEQIGALTGLLRGLYGPPPWTYVGPWAQVSNLLPPAASMFLPGSWTGAGVPGGQVTLAEGVPAYHVVNDAGGTISLPAVPAAAGVDVTASVAAGGSSAYTMALTFRNAAGATLSAPSISHAVAVGNPLPRRSLTVRAPAGAATVQLTLTGALRAALPCLTWTPDAGPWQLGEGAPKVVARGLSKAVQLAVRDNHTMRRTSASFTLDEVGNA